MGKRRTFCYIETAGCVIALIAPAVGVVVARTLISVSFITPMYANTQINFGLMYGGQVRMYELRMGMILAVSSALLLLIIRFKYQHRYANKQAAGSTAA